ncbi:hypothetical protein VTK26DRAFT_3742 [Humicola hyalothermophila]
MAASASSTTTPRFILYRGFPTTPAHVWSPFVNKLEARLRFASVPYRIDVGSPRSAPRGKIPYLGVVPPAAAAEGAEPTQYLSDSTLITGQLVSQGVLPDLNAALAPARRAQDLALRALLEDKFYFFATRERWVDNHARMRDGVLAALPWPVRLLAGHLAYRAVSATLHGQGAGRYSDEEAREIKREVWEALEALLAEARRAAASTSGAGSAGGEREEPFWVLGGEQPSEADATVYGFIASALVCTAAPETQKVVRSFPVLMDYAKRIHDTYFSDYDMWEEQV